MDKKKLLLTSAIAAAFTLSIPNGALAGKDKGKKGTMGKCFGVAKAKENGCQANGHSCGGQAKTDYDANEWAKMSKADCMKKVEKLNKEDMMSSKKEKIEFKWEEKK